MPIDFRKILFYNWAKITDFFILRQTSITIEDYPSMLFAEVEIPGPRKQAIREGFKILANYIFGNNISVKICEKTTSPKDEFSEKIAMTAPVIQEKHDNHWKVRFSMPKKYTLETLPRPCSKKIHIVSYPPKKFAVIRFSGFMNDKNIEQRTLELRTYILSKKFKPIGEVILAFYNPPWTLPFLRRNEILIEIQT